MLKVDGKEVEVIECKHARYFEAQDESGDDVILAKELVRFKDGTSKRRLRAWPNVERSFYITKPGFRNHQEKKEWEDMSKLQRFTCRQTELTSRIRRGLGQYSSKRDRYKNVTDNPYVYGSDINTNVILKNAYDRKSAKFNPTMHTVASLDLETDTTRGTKEILMGAICTLEKVYCYYTEEYIGSDVTIEEKLKTYKFPLLAERIDISNIDIQCIKVEKPVDVTIQCLNKAHELQPDFLAIWNMTFDIGKMKESLEKEGLDPAQYFSDPSVPDRFKYFKYTEAPRIKVTASKTINKHMADLWHVVDAPSSFYVVDAMCVYKIVRTAAGMEPSYALDDILLKHGVGGKLRFSGADGLNKLEWHQKMSTAFKIEYIEYNIFDCLAMLLLDAKTKDLSTTLPLQCSHSELTRFTSNPRKLADDVEFMCRERGLVAGTCGGKIHTELDDLVVGMDQWIITLAGHHVAKDIGIPLYGDDGSDIRTGIMTHSFDSDVTGAYPNGEIANNISKETTAAELYAISGLATPEFRKLSINMTSPEVNAGILAPQLFGVPNQMMLCKLFEEHLESESNVIEVV